MIIQLAARTLVLVLASLFVNQALADNADKWDKASDLTTLGLLGIATGVPALKSDWAGFKQASFATGSALAGSLIIKSQVNERRPDNSDTDSFPSNHAAVAFAAATTLHLRYGWQAGFPAYGVAALTGLARVKADKHYDKDVLAGAALGVLSGVLFTHPFDDKVRIFPSLSEEPRLNVAVDW